MGIKLIQILTLYCFSFLMYYLLRAMGNRELAGIMKIACYAIMAALSIEVIAEAIATLSKTIQPLADGLKSISEALNKLKGGPISWLR